ncbi:DoxX family protein [Burkholderia pseudomallei]|uniref:DoxX family protein n=1 Tax=Burkholderia pseudomallei TaxID=28450 RepID=UPI0009765A93|nr:DoxX family protein [Burkholderia pseudomallei]
MDIKQFHLFLIRFYIGVNFTHHFAEKFGLLGAKSFENVVSYFHSVGFSSSMVIIGGLCEFGAFVGFTFGIFTRLAAVGTSIYLIISLFAGHHDRFGFTWANPGGGWEYPALWAFICLTFVLTGGGRWSIDARLRHSLPARLRWMCI